MRKRRNSLKTGEAKGLDMRDSAAYMAQPPLYMPNKDNGRTYGGCGARQQTRDDVRLQVPAYDKCSNGIACCSFACVA
jgi:hypothetical protein